MASIAQKYSFRNLKFFTLPEVLDGCHVGQQLPVESAVAGLRLCELPTEES